SAKLIAALSVIAAQIPGLESSHPTTVPIVRANKIVPPEFIATMAASVEGEPELQPLRQFFDPVAALNAQQYEDAFRPFANEVGKLFRDVNFTIDAQKARSGGEALAAYVMVKRIARNPRHASVAA